MTLKVREKDLYELKIELKPEQIASLSKGEALRAELMLEKALIRLEIVEEKDGRDSA